MEKKLKMVKFGILPEKDAIKVNELIDISIERKESDLVIIHAIWVTKDIKHCMAATISEFNNEMTGKVLNDSVKQWFIENGHKN